MLITTPNYGLVKPDSGEFYDVQVSNDNLNKIDSELKLIEEQAGEVDLSGLATQRE